jgi:hypothetical protein
VTVIWDDVVVQVPPDQARIDVLATGASLGFTVQEQTDSTVRFKGRDYIWWQIAWEITISPTPPGSTVHVSVRQNRLFNRGILEQKLNEFMAALAATIGGYAPTERPPPPPSG